MKKHINVQIVSSFLAIATRESRKPVGSVPKKKTFVPGVWVCGQDRVGWFREIPWRITRSKRQKHLIPSVERTWVLPQS